MNTLKKHLPRESVSLVLLVSLAFFLVLPLIFLFAKIDGETLKKVFSSSEFGSAILRSLIATAIATVATLVLALAAAYAMARVRVPFRRLFGVLLILPMLIPSISNGAGLVMLLGNGGILTRLLGLSRGVYGLRGIVLGSVLYAFPVAYLLFADALSHEDATPHEAARVFGLSGVRRFVGLTLPYLRRPLISAAFATFALIVTDYGVPLMVGGGYTTVPVILYREVVGGLDFARGAIYGAVLLVPALAAFVADLATRERGRLSSVGKEHIPSDNKAAKWISTAFLSMLSLCMSLPAVAFLLRAFAKNYPTSLAPTLEHFARAFRLGAGETLINSLVVSAAVALVGTAVAFLAAYFAARTRGILSRAVHLLALVSAAVPGLVLGLAFAIAFRGSALFGTYAILIAAGLVHFLASPYLMIYSSLGKMNENLEAVGETLGLSRARVLLGVILPASRGTLLEMASYFFVNCMMTISAVSFLATGTTRPLSLMITQFEAGQQMECAAVVSLVILAVNLSMRGLVGVLKKRTRI